MTSWGVRKPAQSAEQTAAETARLAKCTEFKTALATLTAKYKVINDEYDAALAAAKSTKKTKTAVVDGEVAALKSSYSTYKCSSGKGGVYVNSGGNIPYVKYHVKSGGGVF